MYRISKGDHSYDSRQFLLSVPSTRFLFIYIFKTRGMSQFSKFISVGRFGYTYGGFPFAVKAVLNFDTATLILLKAFDLFFFLKFFYLLRGYYRQIFLSLTRGFRKTLYQYGLGFKAFYYPFQHQIVFKVGRSSRVYVRLPHEVYAIQSKKRRRRIMLFCPYKETLVKLVRYIQKKKPVSIYEPRKGVYERGKLYTMKKSGKLARKGRKKK